MTKGGREPRTRQVRDEVRPGQVRVGASMADFTTAEAGSRSGRRGETMPRIPGTPMHLRPAMLMVMLAVGLIVGLILGPSAANANDGQGMIMGLFQNTSESTTFIARTDNDSC